MWAVQVEPIVRKAGALAHEYFRKTIQRYDKGGGSIVTQVDLLVEKYLKDALSELLPGSGFIAEESKPNPAEYTWVIDPIDGTRNYAHGVPYYAISVALLHNHEFLLGMVYDPNRNELFWGEHGKGAYCNAMPIRTKEHLPTHIEGLLLATNSFVKQDRLQRIMKVYNAFPAYNLSLRCTGSAALDIAYTAAGYTDIAMFQNLSWWDIAAAACIAQQVGLQVTDFQGNKVVEKSDSILIAPLALHEVVRKVL